MFRSGIARPPRPQSASYRAGQTPLRSTGFGPAIALFSTRECRPSHEGRCCIGAPVTVLGRRCQDEAGDAAVCGVTAGESASGATEAGSCVGVQASRNDSSRHELHQHLSVPGRLTVSADPADTACQSQGWSTAGTSDSARAGLSGTTGRTSVTHTGRWKPSAAPKDMP